MTRTGKRHTVPDDSTARTITSADRKVEAEPIEAEPADPREVEPAEPIGGGKGRA